MRYTQLLDDLLGSQARLRILRYLCTAGGEHTGREIARAVGMGETPVHRALKELGDTLVILYRVSGRAHYYRLNEQYAPVKQVLCPLFAAEEAQRDGAITELLTRVNVPLDAVLIYGSVAQGADTWGSDLDVLLVTSTAADARRAAECIWQHDIDLLQRYGVISVQVLSRDELVQRAQNGERWLVEALREGVVVRGALPQHLLERVKHGERERRQRKAA